MTSPERPPHEAGATLFERLVAAAPDSAQTLHHEEIAIQLSDDLPLHDGYRMVRVLIAFRERPVWLLFADDGHEAVRLGSPKLVMELNHRVGLQLTQPTVVPYVRFWFSAATRPTVRLVETASTCNWIPVALTDATQAERRATAEREIRPVTVETEAHDIFIAEATVLEQQTLELVQLRVQANGEIQPHHTTVLVAGVPVTYVRR